MLRLILNSINNILSNVQVEAREIVCDVLFFMPEEGTGSREKIYAGGFFFVQVVEIFLI